MFEGPERLANILAKKNMEKWSCKKLSQKRINFKVSNKGQTLAFLGENRTLKFS